MQYIIGVDIGTSSTKAVAFDLNGVSIAEHSISYPILTPAPTHYEQDPEQLYQAVLSTLAEVAGTINQLEGAAIAGVAFSSAMHGLIALDEAGLPLTNCIVWTDTRSESFAATLKGIPLGKDIYRKTGTPIHPMSPLCKLGWMREHMIPVFSAAHKFVGIKEYVLYRLFSKYVIDLSVASATGLLDIYAQQWYAPALELAGIKPEQLSELVQATYMLKGLASEVAKRLQIPADTPFVVGGSDGCLANLGVQAIKPGIAAVTIGTSGAIRVVTEMALSDPKERLFSYILTPEHYVIGGAVNNGGVIRSWFRQNFLLPEAELADGSHAYDRLDMEAASAEAGSDGLVFLPYLTGERAPHWNAHAKGVYFGIQLHHTRAHFARAMMEGVLFGIYGVGKALEEITGPIVKINASGGFAKSAFWLQMLADVFNKQVVVKESVESSALGAAIIGMHALGLIDDLILPEGFVPSSETYVPNIEKHEQYVKNYAVFERIYDKLKEEF
ncbi:gluconate kinase, FGGY family [bacterium A37T11]|nr:gluconate kinase, FGGY family [bacterium A37T11]